MVADGDASTTESDEFFDDDDDEQSSPRASPTAVVGGGGGDESSVAAANGVKQELLMVPVKRPDVPGALAATPRSAPPSIHVASLFTLPAAAPVLPGATAVKHESHVAAVRHPDPPSVHAAASRPSPAVVHSSATSTETHAHASAPWAALAPATHSPSVTFIPGRGLPTASDYKAPTTFQASRPRDYASSHGGSAAYIGAYPASHGGAAPSRSPSPPVATGAPGPPAQSVYGYRPPPPVDYAAPRAIQTDYQHLPASEAAASSIQTCAEPTTTSSAATSRPPIIAPIPPPPPRIPSSLAVQQSLPVASGPNIVATVQSSTSVAPIVPAAAGAPGQKCPFCKLVVYKVQCSSVASENLQCTCCLKLLPKDACFSRNQRATGKNRCKACLGQANLDASGEPNPTPQLSKNAQKKQLLRSQEGVLGAERQVGKYHLARRSLQRKWEANDLRGSTRVEYEKQLAKEDEELKALEKQLRAKYPQLFDKQVGIQVKAPSSIPRDERDRPLKTKKSKRLAERAEQRAKKKKEQQAQKREEQQAAAKATAGAAVAGSSVPEVFDLTGEPSPGTTGVANPSVPPPKTKAVATPAKAKATKAPAKPKVAAKAKAAANPTTATTTTANKRKEPAASSSKPATKEKPAKKSKTSTTTPNDDKDADPWLVAHDEIAQGLSQLLGGNLDDILGPAASGSSGSSESKKKLAAAATKKEKKPAAKSVAKAPAKAKTPRSQVKQEAEVEQQQAKREAPKATVKPTTFARAVGAAKSKQIKSENALPPGKVKKEARPDPSTYVLKTKLQAETSPQTTIVTHARKRVLRPPPEIIDVTDSPKAATKKTRF